MKKTLIFIFFLISGILLGSLVATLCRDVPALSWLGFSQAVGLSAGSPMVIDLSVITVTFGFRVGISVAQVLCIAAALFAYKRWIHGAKF